MAKSSRRGHKKSTVSSVIKNRQANFNFDLKETYTGGLVLTGKETKALRLGRGQLTGSYLIIKKGELWLIGAKITSSNQIDFTESEQIRTRKVLVKKSELNKLATAKVQGLQIIPRAILTKTRYIKIEFGLGKSRKTYDKREAIKKRDTERIESRSIKF